MLALQAKDLVVGAHFDGVNDIVGAGEAHMTSSGWH